MFNQPLSNLPSQSFSWGGGRRRTLNRPLGDLEFMLAVSGGGGVCCAHLSNELHVLDPVPNGLEVKKKYKIGSVRKQIHMEPGLFGILDT